MPPRNIKAFPGGDGGMTLDARFTQMQQSTVVNRSVAVAQRRTSRSFGMCFNSRIRAAIDGGLDVTVLAQVRSFINPQKRGHVGSDKERFGAAAELVPRVDRRALLHLRKARVQGSSLRRHLETP